MKKLQMVTGGCLALLLFGCASGNKTDLAQEIDPKPAVYESANLMIKAEKQQADLLAFKEYARASENLKKPN